MTASAVGPTAELSIRALTGEVRRASAWLEKAGIERGVPADQINRLELCLNEVLANVMAYGGATALSYPICLHLDVRRDQTTSAASVTVSDAGVAFDPLSVPPKPRPKALAEAEPGGLGLHMIRNIADNLSYRYSDGRNQLTFGVRWTEPR